MSLQLIEAAKVLRFDPATGWPEQFTVNQAIALQTWHEGIAPKAWGSKADDLRRLFALDRGKGAVKVTTTTSTKQVERSKNIEVTFGVPGKRRPVHWVEDVEVKTDHITAEAFAAWLAANEIEPSRHVAAWFKFMAVNTDHRRIETPAGWKAHSPHGLQKIDDTDAGRLVRLADLVQWLMDTRELPCKAAVEEVCSTLEQRSSAAAGWLYLLQRNDYATPLTPEHSFYWLPRKAPPDDNPGDPNDNGLAGAINNMRSHWTETATLDELHSSGSKGLDPLAIRLDVAHLLWNYGRRVDVAEQTQAAAPAEPVKPTPIKETTKQRNARWLAVFDEEERNGPKNGAQARAIRRIVQEEPVTESTAKKGLQNAEKDRAENYRAGKVTPMKRKTAKPATPFDGLTKKS